MPDESGTTVKKEDAKVDEKPGNPKIILPTTGLSLNQKLTLIGAPILVLLAIFIHDPYNKYYVFPLQERTLLPKIDLNLNRLAWRVVDPEIIFALGSHHPQSIKLGVAWKSNKDSNSTTRVLASSVPSYQWIETDGNSFGKLLAFDDFGKVTVDFVIQKDSFIIRVQTEFDVPNAGAAIDFFIYVTTQHDDQLRYENGVVYGSNSLVGNFTIQLQGSVEGAVFKQEQNNKDLESVLAGRNRKYIALQASTGSSTQFQAIFSPVDKKGISVDNFELVYNASQIAFNNIFDVVYNLKSQNFPDFYQSMGKSALAQVFASENYFYGKHLATGLHNSKFETEQVEFLRLVNRENETFWDFDDQLFSLLVMVDINPNEVLNIITSWLNLMNEQENLPIRYNKNGLVYGIPQGPVLFYVIHKLHNQNIKLDPVLDKVATITSHFRKNLASIDDNLYAWRSPPAFLGNTPRSDSNQQANLDLQCWMLSLEKLSAFSNSVNLKTESQEFILTNFFNTETKLFEDFYIKYQNGKKTKHFFSIGNGYVNLLPLMLRLLPHASQQLSDLISNLENSEEVWSHYGVRSLSKTSQYYQEAEPDRGAISISANYMILGGLHYYSQQSGPNQQAAHNLYSRLRNSIIANVAIEFKKTKFFWEYYSDKTGKGMGARRHNWSALILQIMAGKF